MFTNKTINKFLNLKNVGLIKNASGIGLSLEEVCKNIYKIYLQIEEDKVVDAKFKAFGNPDFIAVCDEITERIKNKNIEEILNISQDEIKEIINDYSSTKIYPFSFFKLAIENAVKDYRKKEIKKNINY